MDIVFVCHGNICRSPIAEYVFRELVRREGLESAFDISSAGVSSEESGNDIYPPAKRVLRAHGIPFSPRHTRRISDADFRDADLVVALDRYNLRSLRSRFGDADKIVMLTEEGVDDPWYTGDFDTAYAEICEGCRALLARLEPGSSRR